MGAFPFGQPNVGQTGSFRSNQRETVQYKQRAHIERTNSDLKRDGARKAQRDQNPRGPRYVRSLLKIATELSLAVDPATAVAYL